MANPDLDFFASRGFALKIDAVEGTDPVPTAALNAFELFDGHSMLEADKVERPRDRPYMGNKPFFNTNFRAAIEGKFEIVPPAAPGTDPAAADVLLKVSAMARVLAPVGPPIQTRYNPISKLIPSASGYFWHAGTLKHVVSGRGNITGASMAIKNFVNGSMRFQGSCSDVLEDAVPTDFDFSEFATPTIATTENMSLLCNGFAVPGVELSFDFVNKLNTTQHTEKRVNRITERLPTFKVRMYRTLKADFDPYALWRSNAVDVEAVARLTESDGRYTEIGVLGQIENVQEVDIEGDYGWEITGRCIPEVGGDEYYIALGDA